MCPFTESSKKSEEQEEGALLQEVDTSFIYFLFFIFYFSHLTFLPWFFPHFWILSAFAGDDTGVKGPEVVLEFALDVQVAKSQAGTPQTI